MTTNNPLKPVIAAPVRMDEGFRVSQTRRKQRGGARVWRTEGEPFDATKATRNPGVLTASR